MRKTFASILLTVALAPAAEAGSVLAFGARCDGRTDDSASIQAALDAGGVVTFVDGATCLARDLVIHSNTVVALGTTTLELAGLTPPQTWMLKTALGSSNVIISGGTIRGHRLPASGFVNGIRVDGAADMIIEGTKIVDWPTDGVWVGGVGGTAVNGRSTSVRLSGVEIGNCGRSGISITNADGVRIERSYFHDIHGDPGFGVNGEPNQGDRLTRLVLIDSLFVNNDGGAYLQIAKGLPGIDYTVLNCVFRDNAEYGLVAVGVVGLRIFNNIISGSDVGLDIAGSRLDALSTDVTVTNNTIGGRTVVAGARDIRMIGNIMTGAKPETPLLGISGNVVLLGNSKP